MRKFLGVLAVVGAFLELPGFSTVVRLTLGIWAVTPGGNMAFSVDGSFLLTPRLSGFDVYFGGGVGGLAPAGLIPIIFPSVNGIGGAYFPLAETFGLFAQLKLLGLIDLATASVTALLMSGFGLYVVF